MFMTDSEEEDIIPPVFPRILAPRRFPRDYHKILIHKTHGYQIHPRKLYETYFQHAILIDTYPSFDLEKGRGRIMMFFIHEFQRKIKWFTRHIHYLDEVWKALSTGFEQYFSPEIIRIVYSFVYPWKTPHKKLLNKKN